MNELMRERTSISSSVFKSLPKITITVRGKSLGVYRWEDALRGLEVLAAEADAYSEMSANKFSSDTYSNGYSLVYALCTQQPPHNYSERCYDFVEAVAEKYAQRPGQKRERFIKAIANLFKYLDNFYVPRTDSQKLAPMMNRAMDCPCLERANFHLLKKGFLRWACNEDLLGETHAEGGQARKRQCVLYESMEQQLADAANATAVSE